jgi:hypothetical protein
MHTWWNRTVRRSQPLRKLHLRWNTHRALIFGWSAVWQVLYLRMRKSVCGGQDPGVPFAERKICPKARLDRLHGTCEQGPKRCFHSVCFEITDTRNTELRCLLSELPEFASRCHCVELDAASEITGLPRDTFEVHEISKTEFEAWHFQ